jgi:polyisoprenoid-binding protein YceI
MVSKRFAAFVLTLFLSTQPVWAEVYEIDQAHSSVNFKIKHLFSHVNGSFNDFSGTIDYDPAAPETWKTEAVIQAASIDTNNEKRDTHLRTADFFDVEKYPTLTFKSTKVEKTGENTAKVEGLLSIHGVEKPVVLDAQIHGTGKDPWGNAKAGFSATTKINRKDFGITWNQALETGGVLLGEEVEITLEIEADVKQAEAPAA